MTDVISTIEGQLNKALLETDHYKSSHDKIQKELIDLKKENKKRKKMIETQQGLMNANSSNYHQVFMISICSNVINFKFLTSILKVCILFESFFKHKLFTSSYYQTSLRC